MYYKFYFYRNLRTLERIDKEVYNILEGKGGGSTKFIDPPLRTKRYNAV